MSNTKSFILEILTPDKMFFTGEVESLEAPSLVGSFGVLKNHAPMLAVLKKGKVKYKHGNEEKEINVGEGFVEVLPDKVRILVEGCE
ncbi:MAG: ATP synthase F1 subunit epsilon [Candidatus Firestonebacteria bacterium RIFOXYC2_FULL_39_67]|nr:MAG: ATP synthase F1 subunit epsilon [Candidatus Firestonebacteria bacterium RIFOXYD2_FULL_39_29]OGF55110.1 MAG: ATP synthase F1 subunit epsilon [Candidatus Firestonebacteria bacterium RIFOXYC2_FULL_39_67]OGF57819.1 MAG: ATP synthase F1 subunit epsilon [Candidatus Firestonebacteria bacterium RifOxyC12_full_39_7]